MMNVFQLPFTARMRHWRDLRDSIVNKPISEQCIAIDQWWQAAPFVTRYLHAQDRANWPDPWTLLAENRYCSLAKALGMCYTLWMIEQNSIELVLATNRSEHLGEEHALVLVDSAKYILNYYPNTVLSNNLQDFAVTKTLDLTDIKTKIR